MENTSKEIQEIFSEKLRAGRRTYFFDIKVTSKTNDYYLSITESKRETSEQGDVSYVKRNIVLYKEDLQNFVDAFNKTVFKLKELNFNENNI